MSERELADVKKRSDQRYADLADSVPLLVWTTDAAGHLQYGNRRWESLARGSREFASVIAPDDLPRFLEGWNAALLGGNPYEAELRFGNASDGWRVHLVRVVPRHDESGSISSWVGTSTDIDARVRAERALRMLADASRRLGTTLEDPMEVEAVLRGALPILGDLAMLDVLDGGQAAKRVKLSMRPESAHLLDDPRFALGPSTVAYSGRPEIYLDVADQLTQAHSGRGIENLRFLGELGVTAYMCLPLTSRERSVGTLTLARVRGALLTSRRTSRSPRTSRGGSPSPSTMRGSTRPPRSAVRSSNRRTGRRTCSSRRSLTSYARRSTRSSAGPT